MSGSDSVVIVGGGPAGLACGIELLRSDADREVTVLEREPSPGGIAGGFSRGGLDYDYGSHRIHPSVEGRVLAFLTGLPGLELRRKRRNGRILLGGRLVRFPPSPVDALVKLPPGLSMRILGDQIGGLFRSGSTSVAPGSFSEAVESGTGRTMAHAFYIPYTKKLWGLPADEISSFQAARRVSSARPGGLLAKVLGGLPLVSRFDPSRFFSYPAGGFGALAEALANEFRRLGGTLRTDSEVVSVSSEGASMKVTTSDGFSRTAGRLVWSAPLDALASSFTAAAPAEVLAAAGRLSYRSMILLYVQIENGPYTRFDAHYFPDGSIRFSRMSEPRNYLCGPATDAGRGRTGLCLELPCDMGGDDWKAGPEVLYERLLEDLRGSPLPPPEAVGDIWVRRLTHAYPVYRMGFEQDLRTVSEWSLSDPRLVLTGRQGLFAHDNLHHAIETGLAAADCLAGPGFDTDSWRKRLEGFRLHRVSD